MKDIQALIGTPFVRGGRNPDTGLDCWGLVRLVLNARGLPVADDWHPSCMAEVFDVFKQQQARAAWQEVPWGPWLIVAMGTRTRIYHAGVSLPDSRVLHTEPVRGAVCERLLPVRLRFGQVKCYRSASWG